MIIALIGYGRMGHEIEEIANSRGHTIKLIIDINNQQDFVPAKLKEIDVAIEFSTPSAAFANIVKCLEEGVPVVSGTTGWLEQLDRVFDICKKNKTSFIYSSNFSLGVNLLFRLNKDLARYMQRYEDYNASIEEIHHVKKLDAPSGTAINLANDITGNHSGYNGWCSDHESSDNMIPVHSIREGVVPGIHTVKWESDIDSLILKHEAKNRKGLALGAIVAAEYIFSREGIFTMNDVMGF